MSTTSVEQQIAAIEEKIAIASGRGQSFNYKPSKKDNANIVVWADQRRKLLLKLKEQSKSNGKTSQKISKSDQVNQSYKRKVSERSGDKNQELQIKNQTDERFRKVSNPSDKSGSNESKKKTTGTVLDTITSQRRQRRVSRSPLVQHSYKKKRGY